MSGCPRSFPPSEAAREAEFRRIYGRWPPNFTLPDHQPMKETAAWARYQREKEAGLMALTDHQVRWEHWLEQTQVRSMVNFSESGWSMGDISPEVHRQVQKFLATRLDPNKGINTSVPLYTTGDQMVYDLPARLKALVTKDVQQRVSEWINVPVKELEPTSTYGIRVYWKDSTLKTHVDRVETHILSAVYCVDSKYDDATERWHIEADPDLTGRHVSMELKPGQLFFYESAKLVHGRPVKLQGDYSAHIFVHFRPQGWSYSNIDRVYGVPPGWDGGQVLPDDAPLHQETVEL